MISRLSSVVTLSLFILYNATALADRIDKLIASDGRAIDRYGSNIALSSDGGTLIVGSYFHDSNETNSGAAYVYQKNSIGWQETKLAPSDPMTDDRFGSDVSISDDGSAAVIGAVYDDDNGVNSGSVYIFEKTDDRWSETKLIAADGSAGDFFGESVSISGDGNKIVVGAYGVGDSIDRTENTGAIYLYQRVDNEWLETKLTASDGKAYQYFGSNVAISSDGNTIITGSITNRVNSSKTGAAYIYKWDGNLWNESKLSASDGAEQDRFGCSVSVSANGKRIVVGACKDDDKGTNSGSIYIYSWIENNWIESKLSASDGHENEQFGMKTAISGDGRSLIVGVPNDTVNGSESGSVYSYKLDGNTWVENKITEADGKDGYFFGYDVSLSYFGDKKAVGARYGEGVTARTGAAYIYSASGSFHDISDNLSADQRLSSEVLWDETGSYKSTVDFSTGKSYRLGLVNNWPFLGNLENKSDIGPDFQKSKDTENLRFPDDGPFGPYLEKRADDSIYISNDVINSDATLVTGFSLSAWIRPNELKGVIWSRGYGSPVLRFNEYVPGTLRFSFVGQSSPNTIAASSKQILLNEWTHVACTFNPIDSKLRLYINGELSAEKEAADVSELRNNSNFILGDLPNNDPNFRYDGGISNFATWNRPLADSEVSDLATSLIPIEDVILSRFTSKRINNDHNRFSDVMLDWKETNGNVDVYVSFGGLDWIKVEQGVWLSELSDVMGSEIGGQAGMRYRFDFQDGAVLSDLNIQYKHEIPEQSFAGFPMGTNLNGVASHSVGSNFIDLMIGAEKPTYRDNQFDQLNSYIDQPRGEHTLSFEGSGTITIRTGFGDIKYSEGIHSVLIKEKQNTSYRIENASESDPIKNVKLIMPGFWENHEEEPFHPKLLDSLRGMKVLRFMDLAKTNSRDIVNYPWENRPKPSDFSQNDTNGVAIEYMIKLANKLQIDPWFCIHHLSDDGFIRKYAELVKSQLDPGLNLYVEFSNEAWNAGFPVYRWLNTWRESQGYTNHAQAVARQSLRVIDIFNEVLGEERVIGVLPGRASSPTYNQQLLEATQDPAINANGTKVDSLAIAPYIGGDIINDINADGYVNAVTPQDMLDMLENTLPRYKSDLTTNKTLADQHNVRLITYEGGQHLVGTGRVSNNIVLAAKLMQANRDPRMNEIYRHYFRIWSDVVGDVFTNFTNYGVFSKYGAWSALENYLVKPGDAPKYRAVRYVVDQYIADQTGQQPISGNGIVELTEECDGINFKDDISTCSAYSKLFSEGYLGCSDSKVTLENCAPARCTLMKPSFDHNYHERILTSSENLKLFVQGTSCHNESLTFNVYYGPNYDGKEKILVDSISTSFDVDNFAVAPWEVKVMPDAPAGQLYYFLEAVSTTGESTLIELPWYLQR